VTELGKPSSVAIHVLLSRGGKDVDARNKCGHDELEIRAAMAGWSFIGEWCGFIDSRAGRALD
jgi:hypothetical protein